MDKPRCGWNYRSQADIDYHDKRWCKPVTDDRELFAMLCLEGKQAGLSWSLILEREAGLREAFDGFDPSVVATYNEDKIAALLADPRIIRNRRKVESIVRNARAFLAVQNEFGSFLRYLHSITGDKVIDNHYKSTAEIPAKTELSERLSNDLYRRGFRFVGPVIIYSYMQGVGILNDHIVGCPNKYK